MTLHINYGYKAIISKYNKYQKQFNSIQCNELSCYESLAMNRIAIQ